MPMSFFTRSAEIETRQLKPLADCRLYAFVDTAYLHGRDPAELTRQLCQGGADLVQLRAKNASVDAVRDLAARILPVTRDAGVWFVLNDHADLAAELNAPCCHLGQEDFFDAGFGHVNDLWASRERSGCCVGLSSHAPDQALRAVQAAADYVAVGPVFPTGTKPGRAAVTLDYVRWAASNLTLPWFAIGGIHLGNLDDVLAAGATRICVVSAILNQPDVAAACRQFRERLPN
jgi:thiamine-phosphate pyrophosphorylase